MNQQKKTITEQQALQKLAALCARGEHCQYDLTEKLRRWGVDDEAQARIMAKLVDGHYVDDERYARAFVSDKVRFAKWGRRKVEQALWQKHISEDISHRVLDEVAEENYSETLRQLLAQKRKTIKAASDYELNQKLIRFALSRGFTYDIISECFDL
jgi:regulatory protein